MVGGCNILITGQTELIGLREHTKLLLRRLVAVHCQADLHGSERQFTVNGNDARRLVPIHANTMKSLPCQNHGQVT